MDAERWAVILTVFSTFESRSPALTTVYGFSSQDLATAAGQRWAESITDKNVQGSYIAVQLG
jgi:hypothetical protein